MTLFMMVLCLCRIITLSCMPTDATMNLFILLCTVFSLFINFLTDSFILALYSDHPFFIIIQTLQDVFIILMPWILLFAPFFSQFVIRRHINYSI